MNENIQTTEEIEPIALEEKVDLLGSLVSKFGRQAQQLFSLKHKVELLQKELKRLELNLKTSTKEINLRFKDLRESPSVLTEAAVPGSYEWKSQYELAKSEENFKEIIAKLSEEFTIGL